MRGYDKDSLLKAIEGMEVSYLRTKKEVPCNISISGKHWEIDYPQKKCGYGMKSLREEIVGKRYFHQDVIIGAYIGCDSFGACIVDEDGETHHIQATKKTMLSLMQTGIVLIVENKYYTLTENARNALGKLCSCTYTFKKYAAKTILPIISEEIGGRDLYYWLGEKKGSVTEIVNITSIQKPEGLINIVKKTLEEVEQELNAFIDQVYWKIEDEVLSLTLTIYTLDKYHTEDKVYIEIEIPNEKITLFLGYYNNAIVGCYYNLQPKKLLNDFSNFKKTYGKFKDKKIMYKGELEKVITNIVGKKRLFPIEHKLYTGESLYNHLVNNAPELTKNNKIKYLRFLGELPNSLE